MISLGTLAFYLPAVLLLVVTPGPATLFMLNWSLSFERRAGFMTAAGLLSGTCILQDRILERMRALMERAVAEHVQILAYPEMALTPYVPKRIRDDVEQFFASELPPENLAPLLTTAREAGIIWQVGLVKKRARGNTILRSRSTNMGN